MLDALKNIFVENQIKKIAREEWQSGEFMNYEFTEANLVKCISILQSHFTCANASLSFCKSKIDSLFP